MISARTRALLDHYALAARSLSRASGERMAKEAGQSVEFLDFRPYQVGDELRYVDWKVYARTGRLYTRLYQAERNFALHIILDSSLSMSLGKKSDYGKTIAKLLSFVAQKDSVSQIHLFDGSSSKPIYGRGQIMDSWHFIDEYSSQSTSSSVTALKTFALKTHLEAGPGIAIVISDLFDEASLQPALVALKARGLDVGFLHLVSEADLNPSEDQFELRDIESDEKIFAGPAEVRAYKQAVVRFVERTRRAILQAGFRYVLLKTRNDSNDIERLAFAALIKARILQKR